jgi:hypothetical protein
MMSSTYLAVAAVNLGFIGLLPRIFFDSRGHRRCGTA